MNVPRQSMNNKKAAPRRNRTKINDPGKVPEKKKLPQAEDTAHRPPVLRAVAGFDPDF
ncbi:hypothetical protein [Novosphingobium sp. RL4]|nr:hypothetical protein [Novosphingobium sp. RL4]WRT95292.1 hypothetical protein U9J33_24255 [Novosphingobium sp. RL4]